MALFNSLFGVSPEAGLLLNILGLAPDDVPRFRDCFYDSKQHLIVLHTRTGGGNREDYEEENNFLIMHQYYKNDCDDDFDPTYANFYFNVPEEYKEKLKELFKNHETVAPAEKWQILFDKLKKENE